MLGYPGTRRARETFSFSKADNELKGARMNEQGLKLFITNHYLPLLPGIGRCIMLQQDLRYHQTRVSG